MSEDPKRYIEQLYEEVVNQGNVDAFEKYYAPTWIIHRPWGSEGFETSKKGIAGLLRAFPDLRISVAECGAFGDKVVARCTLRGTSSGAVPAFGPAGRQLDQWWIEIDRLENGKIVETWSAYDRLGVTGSPPAG
jgi:predicted ester cyclase